MSIRERISRILRKSTNVSTSSTSDSDRKSTASKTKTGRMLSRRSKPFNSNSNPNASTPITPRSGSENTACTSIASNNSYPVPENVEGLRWEDMTPSQRITASFNAYEMRFGSSRRVSLEGISPCNTRVMHPPSASND